MWNQFSVVLISCLVFVFIAAEQPAAAEPPILIGHYAAMTGKEATFGQSTDKGIRLAIKDINAHGGLDGRPLELKTYDDKGESTGAGLAVTRLITSDKVVAVLGENTSSLSLAGGAVCQQYGVPMITSGATNDRVTQGRDMVSRICFTDGIQTRALATFVRENLAKKKVAILYDQTQAYSTGLRDMFTKAFTARGGEIITEQAYSGGDLDFSVQLGAIKSARPEVLFIPGYYTDAGNIALQARRIGLGSDVILLGADGWDSEQLAKIGGEAVEGAYYSNHSAPDQPGGRIAAFTAAYKSEYNNETPDSGASLGYDAAMVLYDAMQRCHRETGALQGKDLAHAIAHTKDFPGITGTITMDENRNPRKTVVMVQMKGGRPHWVASVEPH